MTKYAYLNARVSILAGRLLSETRLTELLNQPLGQQRTGNSALDEWLNDVNMDPSRLEQAWLMKMLTDFEVLIRPLSGEERELLLYWLRKCEIANIKTIVRGKLGGLSANEMSSQLMELGSFATLPIDQLLHTEEVSELLRQLENSPYGNIARQARRVFEKEHHLYSLDAAIDRHYLLGLVQRMRTLNAKQRESLLPLFSIFIDRFNLLWLLRYRSSYKLSAAETYYLLVPTPYRLNRNRLQSLVEFNTWQEVLVHLPEPLDSLLAGADSVFAVDQRLIAEIRRVAVQTLKWRSFTLAKVFAYVLLREMETRRVMAIVKGKQLKLNNKIIASAAENASAFMA
jgi:V/A-type H+-transporting ATPase subunit C